MSNYKPRIETNNLDLTSILSTINELPEAGPSVETCTVTFNLNNFSQGDISIAYVSIVNDALSIIDTTNGASSTFSISVAKNSLLYLEGVNVGSESLGFSYTGGLSLMYELDYMEDNMSIGRMVWGITDDGSLNLTDTEGVWQD